MTDKEAKAIPKRRFREYWDDKILGEKKGNFIKGQSYEREPAKTIYCKQCGNDKFLVGSSHYWTALICPNCNYEICIHDG